MPGEWSNRQPFSNPCSEKWLYRGAVINGACLPLVLKVVCIFTFPNCRESLAINGQREVRAIFYRFYENTKLRVKDQRASPLPNTQRFTWPCRSSCNVRFHCQKSRWGKKKNKYKRRRANNLNLHTRVRIVRIITWNSGADKKKAQCSNGLWRPRPRLWTVCVLSHVSKDHKSAIKALGHRAKCLLSAGGCGIVVTIPTPFECQPR